MTDTRRGHGPSGRLRVVSYNIHKGLTAGNLRVVLARMRAALRALDPDLVLLQEIVGAHARYQRRFSDWPDGTQFEYLADRTWPHVAYGCNSTHGAGHHGNAILSRFPIASFENIDISLNRFERRGILHAEIVVPALRGPLHVCCTHLNLLHGHRRRQVAALAARVRAAVPDRCPLVIGGDFNDWRTWVTHELARTIGVEEAYVRVHGQHARTFPGWHPVLALDRIYVRGLQVARAEVLDGPGWQSLSDHLGVHADLRLAAHEGARAP